MDQIDQMNELHAAEEEVGRCQRLVTKSEKCLETCRVSGTEEQTESETERLKQHRENLKKAQLAVELKRVPKK